MKNAIRLAAAKSHVEVTTLIIPGENDSEEEMRELSSWLATISPGIPLHISRFFPSYKMRDRGSTPVSVILKLAEIAQQYLQYVYKGNM